MYKQYVYICISPIQICRYERPFDGTSDDYLKKTEHRRTAAYGSHGLSVWAGDTKFLLSQMQLA